MTEQSHLSDLDLQIAEANRMLAAANAKKAELEKAALAKATADQLERKIKLEQQQKALEDEHNRKVAAIVEARRQREEAEVKAKRDSEAEDRRLAEQADRLRVQQQEREAAERKLREIQQAAYNAELEAKRIQSELARASTPVEPEKIITIQSPTHPLATIIRNAVSTNEGVVDAGVKQPVYQLPTAAALPAQTKPNLEVKQSDLHHVLGEFPSNNRPTQSDVAELLKEFPAENVIKAVKALFHDFITQHTMPSYQIDQLLNRLRNS